MFVCLDGVVLQSMRGFGIVFWVGVGPEHLLGSELFCISHYGTAGVLFGGGQGDSRGPYDAVDLVHEFREGQVSASEVRWYLDGVLGGVEFPELILGDADGAHWMNLQSIHHCCSPR